MRILKYFFIALLALTLCGMALPVFAQDQAAGPYIGLEIGAQTGLGRRDVRISAAYIIRTAIGFLGIAATVIVLIGGYTWMTAGGNDEKIGEAKKWIFAGVIGMAIIFSAYAISNFVLDKIISATINTGWTNDQ